MNAQGKVALITGAGSGIGKAVAMAFLQEGYRVTLAGRRQERLGQAVSEAGVSEKQALIVPTDVRDPAAVRALFARTKETFGRLDVLFNNAGIAAGGVLLEDLSYEHLRTQRRRHHARCHSRGRATARAAGRMLKIPGVACWTRVRENCPPVRDSLGGA